MKPTQNNRPQRAWRQVLTPEELRELELLEWQIDVLDIMRKQVAMRRGFIQARASQRTGRMALRKRMPAAPLPPRAGADA